MACNDTDFKKDIQDIFHIDREMTTFLRNFTCAAVTNSLLSTIAFLP